MHEKHKVHIEKIVKEMECPKDFECYKSGFKNMTKVKDMGMGDLVQCLGENSQTCKFAVPFGYSWFCRCPLRVYIAKNIEN